MRNPILAALITVSWTLAACKQEITSAKTSAILTTDQRTYVGTPIQPGSTTFRFTVITRYQNNSSAPIFIEACGGTSTPGVGFQYTAPDGTPLQPADQLPFACSAGAALVVQPGAMRVDTLTVWSAAPAVGRVFFGAGSCANDPNEISGVILGCPQWLAESDRTSNVIQVAAPSH